MQLQGWMNHLRRWLITNGNLGVITRVNHNRISPTDDKEGNMALCFYIFNVLPCMAVSYA